ncbi:MAG: DUF1631 family protein [Dokdonella sp.]
MNLQHADHLATLAESKDMPERMSEILKGLLMLCGSTLEIRIDEALTEFEKQLIRLADKAPNEQQNSYFDSVHRLKRRRAEVMPRFLSHVEDSLARLGEDVTEVGRTFNLQPMGPALVLAEGAALDESIVLSDIAVKVELRVREPLFALGQRLGQFVGKPRLAAATMALGPHSLVDALCYGTCEMDLALEHRLVMLRCFERVVLNDSESLYNTLNQYLVQQNILPHLHELSTPGGSGRASASSAKSDSRQQSNAFMTPSPGSGHSSGPRALSTGFGAVLDESPRFEEQPGPSRPVDFGSLRQLLGGCRRAGTYTAGPEDIQSALAALQARQATATMADDKLVLYTAERTQQEMLVVLREYSADGHEPIVDEETVDTIALIAMLIDYLSRCARPYGITHWILVKLQMPILRVALKDKSFFSNQAHPARQLLDNIVEFGRFWVDETEIENDPLLVSKLQLVTNTIASEYQGRVSVFTDALQVLLQHVDSVARQIELAERRYVDAARGHDRLEWSRMQADAAISARIAENLPNPFLRTLLEQAWVDVLSVSLLRDGEDSIGYQRRLEVVDRLLSAMKGEDDLNRLTTLELSVQVEEGLTQLGMHGDDIKAILRKLFASSFDQDENPISQTELAIKLRALTRFGAANLPAEKKVADRPVDLTLKPVEQVALDRIQTLPPGTWFEFVVNPKGDTVRRKLSWYSTLTGRCLFINRRGLPTEEMTLAELAREIASERARIACAEQTLPLDRAWSSIVATLKRFSTPAQELAKQTQETHRHRFAGPAPLSPQDASRTLLLVDDEENILRALSRVLRGNEYRILTAKNARDGLEMLGQHEVQVIISDQRMPEVGGTEFLGQVKEIYPDTVRIMLSGYSDAAAVTDAINRGVVYKFLTKPWDDEDIRLQVQNAFRDFDARLGALGTKHDVVTNEVEVVAGKSRGFSVVSRGQPFSNAGSLREEPIESRWGVATRLEIPPSIAPSMSRSLGLAH